MSSDNDVDILLVEDNASDAELTIRALKKQHIANRIFLVTDGEEALDFVFARGIYQGREKETKPKLILLDIKLPMVNGMEVLRELKSNQDTKEIPVVILTSSAEETDIYESYQSGANSYIVKPVDLENFMNAVANLGMYWILLNKSPGIPGASGTAGASNKAVY